ncbi:EAL domain-containing protein [Mycobacterium sp. SMC-4]|uniref:EAL domain-containing protein n=1 Tax=Mycobacterium sp. SMC-4 TaxID=2857059 RepID=UPI0021B3B974|nr:EAL domain-containing protein [Mycobacterium sp. SMC-4]UXA18812.1 EAL domain-containing protein [Mycobacterium sp. SMC-4]
MSSEPVNLGFTADRPEIPVDLARTLLGVLRQRLGLDTAWLSSFHDGMQVIEVLDGDADALDVSAGKRSQLSESYCVRVIDGRLPAVIPDTSANQITAALPVTRESGIGAYLGVPVLGAGGTMVGMVCVVSQDAKPYLTDDDLRIVKQVADLIGTLIDSPARAADPTVEQRKAIRRVVAEEDFEVVFQAIHDAGTGKVVGVEALSRFPCEPFQPDAFFRQAALLGLDVELETAIVRRVLSLIPQLPEDVFVAMNISPTAALAMPWPELLAGVDASRIVLEITEHDAVPNYAALEEVLQPCRAKGMRLAVDDVGAGFASFSHVLELAPELVKIDQSITRHIDADDARRRLAQAIAEFAGQIGATVIAEGVETQGELDAVAAAGITQAQGFYLGRPQPYDHGFPTAPAAVAPEHLPTPADLLGERPFELALAYSPIGMAVVGLDGTFLRTNRALRSMLGYNRPTLAGMTFQQITHPDDLDSDLALVAECLEGRRRSYRMDKRYLAADGRVVWCALTAVLVHAPRDRPLCFVSQIVDVTADRMREAELARQAATDPLTRIANRSAGWSRLEQLDADNAGYGVLFCDIERFKSVNDQCGHHAGDQLLVEVATRLLAAVNDDDLVVRWGGDEFLVITETTDDAALTLLAGRITAQFDRAPIALPDGTDMRVALTIGFAAHRPGDGRGIDDVLDCADQHMYQQRRTRDGTTWYPNVDIDAPTLPN